MGIRELGSLAGPDIISERGFLLFADFESSIDDRSRNSRKRSFLLRAQIKTFSSSFLIRNVQLLLKDLGGSGHLWLKLLAISNKNLLLKRVSKNHIIARPLRKKEKPRSNGISVKVVNPQLRFRVLIMTLHNSENESGQIETGEFSNLLSSFIAYDNLCSLERKTSPPGQIDGEKRKDIRRNYKTHFIISNDRVS